MSQENVEAFKRGLEAGNRGDVEKLLDELDPEAPTIEVVLDNLNTPSYEVRSCSPDRLRRGRW